MPKYQKWLQKVVDAAENVLEHLGEMKYTEPVYEEALSHELRIRSIPKKGNEILSCFTRVTK